VGNESVQVGHGVHEGLEGELAPRGVAAKHHVGVRVAVAHLQLPHQFGPPPVAEALGPFLPARGAGRAAEMVEEAPQEPFYPRAYALRRHCSNGGAVFEARKESEHFLAQAPGVLVAAVHVNGTQAEASEELGKRKRGVGPAGAHGEVPERLGGHERWAQADTFREPKPAVFRQEQFPLYSLAREAPEQAAQRLSVGRKQGLGGGV